jgi:hypothetical protein
MIFSPDRDNFNTGKPVFAIRAGIEPAEKRGRLVLRPVFMSVLGDREQDGALKGLDRLPAIALARN